MNKIDEALGIIEKYLSIESCDSLWRWNNKLTEIKRYEEAFFCYDKAQYNQECGDFNYKKGEII